MKRLNFYYKIILCTATFICLFNPCYAIKPKIYFKDALNPYGINLKNNHISIKSTQSPLMPSDIENSSIEKVIDNLSVKYTDVNSVTAFKFPSHYVLFLAQRKTQGIVKVRVDINKYGVPLNTIEPYELTNNETDLMKSGLLKNPMFFDCTGIDPDIQFVILTSLKDFHDIIDGSLDDGVSKTVDMVYQAASQKYKTVKILGKDATPESLINYMYCPKNLKGVFVMNHGSKDGLYFGGNEDEPEFYGYLPYSIFHDDRFNKKYYGKGTMVFFIGCGTFNGPLATEMIHGNTDSDRDYQSSSGPLPDVYVGINTNATNGYLSLITGCLASQMIQGEAADYITLRNCQDSISAGNRINYSKVGIAYPARLFKENDRMGFWDRFFKPDGP